MALLEAGQLDESELALLEAIRIKPTQAAPLVALGRLQAERGDFDLACQSARTALALRPKFADAYCLLANILRGRLPDTDIQAMQGLLDQKYLEDRVRARLHFSLAGVLDARGFYSGAVPLLTVANALQSSAWAAGPDL